MIYGRCKDFLRFHAPASGIKAETKWAFLSELNACQILIKIKRTDNDNADIMELVHLDSTFSDVETIKQINIYISNLIMFRIR